MIPRKPITMTDGELAQALRVWSANRRKAGIGPKDCDMLDEAADRLTKQQISDIPATIPRDGRLRPIADER